jgi:hypothetical protein
VNETANRGESVYENGAKVTYNGRENKRGPNSVCTAAEPLTTSNEGGCVMADSDYLTTPLTDPNVSAAHTEQVER